jgi:hypothetical protein
MTSHNNLFNYNGSFDGNGVNLPQNYGVPKGNPFYYGVQESLLNKPDNQTRVNGYMGFNMPSPYKNPGLNYGNGPYIANLTKEVISAPDKDVFMKNPILREPTTNNPFMNVMPMDYDAPPLFADYNHYEKSTYPSKKELRVRDLVKNDFEKGLIQNADSLFWNRLNSQREFVSQPVGSVPSQQGEFANWLYGNKNVCKQASVFVGYGVEYTDDSLLCNGFNTGEPTNMGLLNGNLMSSVYQG